MYLLQNLINKVDHLLYPGIMQSKQTIDISLTIITILFTAKSNPNKCRTWPFFHQIAPVIFYIPFCHKKSSYRVLVYTFFSKMFFQMPLRTTLLKAILDRLSSQKFIQKKLLPVNEGDLIIFTPFNRYNLNN